VTATERAFTDPPPARLYLDTDILIAYLVSTEPHHARCREFLGRLVQARSTAVYVSSLSWLEFTHVITREGFRTGLAAELQQRFRLHRWAEPLVRQRYVQALLRNFEDLLEAFVWSEVSLTPQIRVTATQYVAQYNLGSQDAVHLASATETGVFDIASLDRGFRRVDGIDLWNDLIYATQPT
jgi:predicted nucleic acid-binding protein